MRQDRIASTYDLGMSLVKRILKGADVSDIDLLLNEDKRVMGVYQ